MARVTTLQAIYRPLMQAPSVVLDHCAICGARWPLNQHHVVWRSWGEMYEDRKRLQKPTITLCGNGNTSGCHGKAHHRQLHFRYNALINALEYLETEEPTRYLDALKMEGWKVVRAEWRKEW